MSAAAVLLTHTDLDGAGCGVLYAAAGPADGRIELIENGAIDERVATLLATRPDEVVVADHGLSEAAAGAVDDYVAGGGRFALLDHHKSSLPLAGRPWATIDMDHSATGLLFEHLGAPPAHAEFARLVEDHDLWRHADPRSAQLAALLGMIGHERFRQRFTGDPAMEFREGELLVLEVEAGRRADYLKRTLDQAVVRQVGGGRWAICFAEQYQSDLAEALMQALEVDATAIVNPSRRTVSMRGRGVDVSVTAERFGGGGHARAAAFSLRGHRPEELLDRFVDQLAARLAP